MLAREEGLGCGSPHGVRWMVLLGALLAGVPGALRAAEESDFTDLSLEELLRTNVTSASRRPEELRKVASAIYVVTSEDIRRSGHTSLPEVLRLVPGLQVSRAHAGVWAVTARGFQDVFANKLLVMIDGQTIYTDVFSGTNWDQRDVPIANIDRIEVIRGPGATLWGSNAVNGVINVITRHTRDTLGSSASFLHGNEERAIAELRHGAQLGEKLSVRLTGRHQQYDGTVNRSGDRQPDELSGNVLAGRMDWSPTAEDDVRFSSRWYSRQVGSRRGLRAANFSPAGFVNVDENSRGGSSMLEWNHRISDDSGTQLAGYVDVQSTNALNLDVVERIFDLAFQHHLQLSPRQQLTWGAGGRYVQHRFDDSPPTITFRHLRESHTKYSLYAQDRIQLVDERLELILGSKLEHHAYTGWEVQPTARLMFQAGERDHLWAAVSRAVRSPARSDRDFRVLATVIPAMPPFVPAIPLFVEGSRRIESEVLVAYEMGWRSQLSDRFALDTALFWNDYENLIDPAPLVRNNSQEAHTYGAEVSLDWQPRSDWKLRGSWTGLQVQLNGVRRGLHAEGASPHHQLQLHSLFELAPTLELDTALYYTGRTKRATETFEENIGSHLRFDVRLGWKPRPNLELSLVAQNVFDRHHPEFSDFTLSSLGTSEIERSIYLKTTWTF